MTRFAMLSSMRVAQEDDPLAQKARVDVVGALATARGFDHHRHEHRTSPLQGSGYAPVEAAVRRREAPGSVARPTRSLADSTERRPASFPRVLDVRQSRRLGMGGEPLVHEQFYRPRPPEGAPNVVSAAFRFEVADQVGVVRVARPRPVDLGLDVRVGDLDALLLGDLREHEERLDALLRLRPEVGVDLLLGLADDLEVRLLADALAGQRGAQLVVHDLDFLVDQDVRQLDRGVVGGVLDDLVREVVAGVSSALASRRLRSRP
jgi:hypothetical protein